MVIAIIAILISLLLPAVQKVREAANRMKCTNNLKQLGIALHAYHGSFEMLPPGGAYDFSNTSAGLGFLVYILPYVEQQALFNNFHMTELYNSANNVKYWGDPVPKGYLCPSFIQFDATGSDAPTGKIAHYAGNMGPKGTNPAGGTYDFAATTQGGNSHQGVLGADYQVKLSDITDGTSNTLMVGEIGWADNAFRAWTRGCGDTYGCTDCKNLNYGLNVHTYTGTGDYNDVQLRQHASRRGQFRLLRRLRPLRVCRDCPGRSEEHRQPQRRRDVCLLLTRHSRIQKGMQTAFSWFKMVVLATNLETRKTPWTPLYTNTKTKSPVFCSAPIA